VTEPKRDIPASKIPLMIKIHAQSRSLAHNCFDGTRGLQRRQYFLLMVLLLLTVSLPVRGYAQSIGGPAHSPSPTTPVDWVNPYIGTGGGGTEYGGTMPLVAAPFGMTDWTAQTAQNKISVSSYRFEDHAISGFIGTHQPAIWMGVYGYLTVVPEVDAVQTTPASRARAFARSDEITTPYYYSVFTDAGQRGKLRTEITATSHCGLFRFTFPAQAKPLVVIEGTRAGVTGSIQVDPVHHQIYGYNPDRMDAHLGPLALPHFRGYFVVEFDRPFHEYGTYIGPAQAPNQKAASGSNVGAYIAFEPQNDAPVEAKVSISFVSVEQARANLHAELPTWDFTAVRDALKKTWNVKLRIASLEGGSEDERKIFYTGLYHALLYPRELSEQGRYYSAFDDSIHHGNAYTAYSLWDTYRAENSLITIFAPERENGMVQALLQDYQEGGWMPKWPNPSYTNIMVGTPADSIVAEAMKKGFRGFDYRLAYQAVYKDAMTPPDGDTTRRWTDREPHTPYEARAGLTFSKRLGYIPVDKTAEAASSTLEGAYEDWDVAQVAKAIGNQRDYVFFRDRSLNYKLLYNPATGFMQGRNFDGSWAKDTDGWTEGDKWVYTWSVLHDVPGLIALMGGPDRFNAKLDEHFSGGHNRHDNEPSHHTGYLYDFSGEPWKTQFQVRKIAADYYSNTPNGVAGNEDCGQMSAWYIFTALGFYPVNPASGDYMIGSPLFDQATLRLPNGSIFKISAENNSARNVYIQSASLNGKPLTAPVITYAQIEAGGELRFLMGPQPSSWASKWHPEPLKKLEASGSANGVR
jgi:predicted alpha-1,2-mannosidase